MPVALTGRFRANADAIIDERRRMLNDLISTIKSVSRQDRWRKRCDNCGIKFSKDSAASSVNQVSAGAATVMEVEPADQFAIGLQDASQEGFDTYHDLYEERHGALPTERQVSISVRATRYADVVRRLGDKVETRLDQLLTNSGGEGDYNKTIAAIDKVFEEIEARGGRGGRAVWCVWVVVFCGPARLPCAFSSHPR